MMITPTFNTLTAPYLSINIPEIGEKIDANKRVLATVRLISASLTANSSISLGKRVWGTNSVIELTKK